MNLPFAAACHRLLNPYVFQFSTPAWCSQSHTTQWGHHTKMFTNRFLDAALPIKAPLSFLEMLRTYFYSTYGLNHRTYRPINIAVNVLRERNQLLHSIVKLLPNVMYITICIVYTQLIDSLRVYFDSFLGGLNLTCKMIYIPNTLMGSAIWQFIYCYRTIAHFGHV